MIKSDGSVMVHADTGGYKPQNWMTPPTVIEEERRTRSSCASAPARPRTGSTSASPRSSPTSTHDMGEAAALEKDGVERDLQERWPTRPSGAARASGSCAASGRPTSARSTSCAATTSDGWIAVEIKRVGDDRRRRAADALPRAHPPRPGDGRRAAACSPRRRSSRRRACWPRRAGSRCVEVDLAVAARRARAGPHAVRGLTQA